MPHEYLLPFDQLQQMDDLSGAALYRAEVRRIPLMAREEQSAYIESARSGDETAQHELILNCLNWTMRRAWVTYRNRSPDHLDMMDLVGQANMKMVEALPNALAATDPVAYLMSVSAREMNRYCTYHDPLIKRQRDQPLTRAHPGTVSLDGGKVPLLSTTAEQANATYADRPEYQLVYNALAQLSARHQIVLIAAYGLHGQARQKNEDIALMLNLPKGTVEKYLWRAKRRLAAKLAPYLGELGLNET